MDRSSSYNCKLTLFFILVDTPEGRGFDGEKERGDLLDAMPQPLPVVLKVVTVAPHCDVCMCIVQGGCNPVVL